VDVNRGIAFARAFTNGTAGVAHIFGLRQHVHQDIRTDSVSGNTSIRIFIHAVDQKVYVDEWLDCHINIGFGGEHVYDGTADNFMQHGVRNTIK